MNTALIQPDPEQQRSNKGNSNSNNNSNSNSNSLKLKNATSSDTHPLIAPTNSNTHIVAKTSTTVANATTATTATTTTTAAQNSSGRSHGIYGNSLTASLSKVASSSRDYLYPVGSHGSLSTSYDAFFTDDGYNEAEQGGIMTVPYTNGPVEFEDSRFYEGRYEDGVHDEYDYDAPSSGPGHGQQQQQQQSFQARLKFSEDSVATEPTILAGNNYRRHRQQSSTTQSNKQLNDQALTIISLGSPLRYREMNSSSMTFGGRNESGREAYRYHLPSQSQLFQPEFIAGIHGAGGYGEEELEAPIMEDSSDNVMREEEEEEAEKHKGGSWKQSGAEQDMAQDETQQNTEEDDDDDDEDEDDEEEIEVDNDGNGESDDGEDDDEDDEGGPGGTAKGRKKSSRPVTSQKTLPKATVPSMIQKEHHDQQQLYQQQQAYQHDQNSQSHSHSDLHHQHPHPPHYQTLHHQQQQHQQQHQHSASSLSLSSSTSSNSTSSHHSTNFISEQQFLLLADDYLLSLSPKKREKALLSNSMYQKILMVLIQPKNTQVSTAQFRFWAKKMFTLSTTPTHHVVCHGGKPVATKECLYDVLVYCHRKSSHGGRDKTSAEVRQHYSWVPKELIARFVKHCPLCLSRRSTQQRQNGPSSNHTVGGGGSSGDPSSSLSLEIDGSSPSTFLDSRGQRFESDPHHHPHHHQYQDQHHHRHHHGGAHLSAIGGGATIGDEESIGHNDSDNGDIDLEFQMQQQQQQHEHRFSDGQRGVPNLVLSVSTQQQQHSGQYGHPHLHPQNHTQASSSMQRTGYDGLQSPNSPIGNTHEGSQPWAWREDGSALGVGVMDLKDGGGGGIDRQQQQQAGERTESRPSSILMSSHNGGVVQDFRQVGDDGMQVDRNYEHGLDHDASDSNDGHSNDISGDVESSQTMAIIDATTRSSTSVHSGLYYNNKNSNNNNNNNNQDTLGLDDDEQDTNGNSPSGMVGISQDLGQYDGPQYRDPSLLHHEQQQQQQQQQQRLFQQNHHPHPHTHRQQHSQGGQQHNRHHPYQHHHRHANSNDNSTNTGTATTPETTQAPPVTVHPNGHILHDRHPIHNRARIMALANANATSSVAAALTGTGGGEQGQTTIPPIHAIHQAALTLSQQYRHHHHHHHQHNTTQHGHHPRHHQQVLATAGAQFYHGHHPQQQHQQQSYRQIIPGYHNQQQQQHHHHPGVGVVSGHPSAFMYAFANPGREDEQGAAYDHEGSEDEEGENDDDIGQGDHDIDDVDIVHGET